MKESASLIDKGRLRGENVVFILRWTTRQTGKEVVGWFATVVSLLHNFIRLGIGGKGGGWLLPFAALLRNKFDSWPPRRWWCLMAAIKSTTTTFFSRAVFFVGCTCLRLWCMKMAAYFWNSCHPVNVKILGNCCDSAGGKLCSCLSISVTGIVCQRISKQWTLAFLFNLLGAVLCLTV